jgi:uncharacterized protein involved in exopolysaccharide biosynthesis
MEPTAVLERAVPDMAPAAGAGDASHAAVSARELFGFMWRHVITLCVAALICAVAGFVIASLLPRKYRSIVVMVPSESMDSATGGGLMSQLGGLAQVAGLPGVGGNSERDEAYEVLHSRTLAWHFIEANHLAPLLFPKRWDERAQRWKTTGRGEPSMADQVKEFNTRISSVSQDKLAGTIRVSITWTDPKVAAEWANALVVMANKELRERAIGDATQMVDYLDKQIEHTQSTEVREALFSVMERELRKSAIANVSREFAFKVVDPAMVPDDRDWASPSRAVYSLIGGLLGLAAGAAIGLRREARRPAPARPEKS